jgi:hypothetical protein
LSGVEFLLAANDFLNNQKALKMNVQEFVDFKLRTMLQDIEDHGEIVQVTLRMPFVDRCKADVVCRFIRTTRNALFAEILRDGLDAAFNRLKNNPVARDMRVDDKTLDEALDALLSGSGGFRGDALSDLEDAVNVGKVRIVSTLHGAGLAVVPVDGEAA